MATNYQIQVLSPIDASIQAVFDGASFYNLRYNRVISDIGQIALLLPSTAANRKPFVLDAFIEVYRTNPNTNQLSLEGTYLTRNIQRFRVKDEEQFLIGGFSLEHFLTRRVIYPADDPSPTADGYSAKSGFADVVMHDYAQQQIGPGASSGRPMPGLTIAGAVGVGNQISQRYRFDKLFKVFLECRQKGRVDFTITRQTGATFLLTIAQMGAEHRQSTNFPFNPWVGLSPYRGNLTEPSLLVDRNTEQNWVFVMGQGKGLTRASYQMAAFGQQDSPYNRIEFFKDARSVNATDSLGLQTVGVAELEAQKYKTTFTFVGTGQEPGNVYRQDWDVGDYVTVLWDEYTSDLRLTGVEIEANSSGEIIRVSVLPLIQNA